MALHLVFTDKQQIISKSQQPCVVRFLQEPTSISLQPASPPAPLPLLFFSPSGDCFTLFRAQACACMRLISSDCLSPACVVEMELPSEETDKARDKENITRKRREALPANGNRLCLSCYLHIYMTVAVA